jgi:NADPH:quinone reductase-like Zn-dependent oxidoreductase
MRAFVVRELAHPSGITLSSNVPEPTAGKNQVLIDVYSAGLNFFDVSSFVNSANVLKSPIARFCNLKANTNINHPYHLYLAPSSRV